MRSIIITVRPERWGLQFHNLQKFLVQVDRLGCVVHSAQLVTPVVNYRKDEFETHAVVELDLPDGLDLSSLTGEGYERVEAK